MVPDPYKILGLAHDASEYDIKRAYRKLAMQLHPDRLTRLGISEAEMKKASSKFAAVTAAHAILKDPQKKRQYDHIYKFGGYDREEAKKPAREEKSDHRSRPRNRGPSKGIGYTFIDPLKYVMSQGKVKSQAVAGVTIPSRFAMAHSPDAGFKVSISKGERKQSDTGSVHCRSSTLQFSGGKKHNTVQTTTIHRDGRRETLIQGDDYVERRYSKAARRKRAPAPIPEHSRHDPVTTTDELTHGENDTPWHAQVINGISSNLKKCVNPDAGAWHAQALTELGSNIQKCVNPDLCTIAAQ